MACSLQGGSGSRSASPALVLRPPWPPRRCESGASSRLQCRAARKPRAASCLAAAQRMATTDNRPQASTSKGAASSKRKSTPQCHTQRAASALNIKAARPKEDLELITPRGRYIGPIRQPPEETTYILDCELIASHLGLHAAPKVAISMGVRWHARPMRRRP